LTSLKTTKPPTQKALVLYPHRSGADEPRSPEARLAELVGLAEALDLNVTERRIAPLRSPAPATLLGAGKVAEIAGLAAEKGLDVVVVDASLSPVQQRNLERAWQTKVVDRTGLILEIFGRRARSREGKLQVELARLGYEASRLVRTWTHLERQRGSTMKMGGPGETQIESDRRLIGEQIQHLKRELDEVRRTRELGRESRRRTPFPIVALVGYTNAGKSTLFNRLTAAGVDARNALFATLDPTMRRLRLPGGRPAILSDTVGFISGLPHELVEAFRATLEEVKEAHVVLHVRDIASPDSEAEADDVVRVLEEIGAGEGAGQRVLEVWNKIDLLDDHAREGVQARSRRRKNAVAMSAATGQGEDRLIARLSALVDDNPVVTIGLDAADGEGLAWLYRHGRILGRKADGDDQMIVRARLEPGALARFERMRPNRTAMGHAE
jgi:GTP-binding protein HflX